MAEDRLSAAFADLSQSLYLGLCHAALRRHPSRHSASMITLPAASSRMNSLKTGSEQAPAAQPDEDGRDQPLDRERLHFVGYRWRVIDTLSSASLRRTPSSTVESRLI